MILRNPINVVGILNWRHHDRLLELADDYEEEAAQHALAGRPHRAHYLELWSKDIRDNVHLIVMRNANRATEALLKESST